MSKLIVTAILVSMAGRVAAQEAFSSEITVRTYRLSISDDEFRAVRVRAGEILGQAGIGVSWRRCWSDDPSVHPALECVQPLLPNELVLRVAAAPRLNMRISAAAAAAPIERGISLGFSYVDLAAGAGSLATVYPDRVRDLCRCTESEGARLLGQAVAHEIGHLLLGTSRHAASGLMRSAWSRGELRRKVESDWRFLEAEGLAMRNALETRTRK